MLLLLLVLVLCARACAAGPSHNEPGILERLHDSDDRLRAQLAPRPVPYYAPYDISGYDGTMEGHEVEAIRRVTANAGNGPATIRYGVYNLNQPAIVQALLDAFRAGVKVQCFVGRAVSPLRIFCRSKCSWMSAR